MSEQASSGQNFNTRKEEKDDAKCFYCKTFFCDDSNGEVWIQCGCCKQWAHEECAGAEGRVFFICEFCYPTFF